MTDTIDPHVRAYLDDGYVVVPGLFSADQVAALIEDGARFARGDYPLANAPDVGNTQREGSTDDEALQHVLAIHFPHWVSPVAKEAVHQRAVCEVLSKLVGAHLPWWDGSVKCMQSMLFVKPPGFPGQAWHQDERFIPTRDRSLLGAWIALDDATADNGCLRVLPASHQPGIIYRTRPHNNPDEFDPGDEAYGFDTSGEVLVEVAAGSVIFFNGYLLHRSLRNASGSYRRALVNHYCSASTLLPWQIKSETPVATADYRVIVPVTGQDPYDWKGVDEPPGEVFVRPHQPRPRSSA